ncbi:uncharacterized protein LOC130630550 [Hydractinia symbiolongicarpus]|uniref:uncharacterized protein LOC130630550 n=1 Tax=Hydractinia symbiolongicarpus TaxID=13093 RepID=UPI0025513C50|nr:uncharacterized protein LOC130630550 [Hydractinia symbiolongicarpus]
MASTHAEGTSHFSQEEIEEKFVKFLSHELENNTSNWKEFYKVLEEACNQEKEKEKQAPKCDCKKNNMKQERTANHTFKSHSAFKINTERTKQQYKERDNSNAFSEKYCTSAFTQKDENNHNAQGFNFSRGSTQQNNFQSNQDESAETENSYRSMPHKNTERTKNLPDEKPCKKNRQRKKQACKQNLKKDAENNAVFNNIPNGSNDTFKTEGQADPDMNFRYDNDNFYTESFKVWFEKFLQVVKRAGFFVVCLIIMFLWIVVKFLFHTGMFLIKMLLWVFLLIIARCIYYAVVFNAKYRITSKIRLFFFTILEIFHLVTGFNVNNYFQKKNSKLESDNEDEAIDFPTSSSEAVRHLLQQKENKPYRTLCLTRNASNADIKSNYRKLALLVHPDKCEDNKSDDAFKVLDAAFKKISDTEKREETAAEEEQRKQWDAFSKQYSDDFQKMFDEMINTLPCSNCDGRHPKTLMKDRNFLSARYCRKCNTSHAANDGDLWAETNMLGLNWTCYACLDGEIYELTDWARCQNLHTVIPANSHRVPCRLGGIPRTRRHRPHEHQEYSESTYQKKKKGRKGRKRR